MSLNVNLQDVSPFLTKTLTASETPLAESWVRVLSIYLNARYGERITVANQEVFCFYIAEAITRKLRNPNPQILSQSVEGASVTYAANSTRGDLFLPAELRDMDGLVGKHRIGSIRFTAPTVLDK